VTSLAARLYAALAVQPGNLAFSPHSIAVALALPAYGARGRTRDEIEAVVAGAGQPLPESEWVELSSADRLFGQRGPAWRPGLEELLTVVDYDDAETARGVINRWVSEQTHERIPAIVPAGVLTRETLLVLVNALYLKAPWLEPFVRTSTADADFHLADGTVARVPTMLGHLAAQVGYGDGWRSARLPYVGGTLAMTVVVPDEGRLADVEAEVSARDWAVLLEAPGYERLELRMPRFKVRSSAGLGELLIALGMPTAFSDEADFSGFTADAQLKITAVLHEAFVAVDELGTEAAATTAVAMQRTAAILEPPVPFVVDRPFLFVIHTVGDDEPIFVGRLTDPR
jgi:serpin B